MPRLLGQLSSTSSLTPSSAETPIQQFFLQYGQAVDSAQYTTGTPLKYYSENVIFHNQNNVIYQGAAQMWPWMQQMFGQFSRLQHPIHAMWEIEQDNGESLLMVQMTRNVWVSGENVNGTEIPPDVSAPAFWIARIGKADEGCEEAFLGLQFKEVWLYWDTMLLAPFMGKDAVVFKTNNVVVESEDLDH